MEWYAIREDEAFLAHHGVLGQKWGVRRYQNEDGSLKPSARGRYGSAVKKELNRNDKKIASVAYDVHRMDRKAGNLQRKADKAEAKGRSDKAAKYNEKANKYIKRSDEYSKQLHDIRARSEALVKDALKNNFNVLMKDTYRTPAREKGKAFVQLAIVGVTAYNQVSGTKYKLDSNGSGKTIDNRKRSPYERLT